MTSEAEERAKKDEEEEEEDQAQEEEAMEPQELHTESEQPEPKEETLEGEAPESTEASRPADGNAGETEQEAPPGSAIHNSPPLQNGTTQWMACFKNDIRQFLLLFAKILTS